MITPEDFQLGEKLIASMKPGTVGKEDFAWDIAKAISDARDVGEALAKTRHAAMLEAAILDERETADKREQVRYQGLLSQKLAEHRAACIQVLEAMAAEVRKNSPGKEYLLALAVEKIRVAGHAG